MVTLIPMLLCNYCCSSADELESSRIHVVFFESSSLMSVSGTLNTNTCCRSHIPNHDGDEET